MDVKRGHLPYRGQPQPKYPKRKRQIRNLKLEKFRDTKSVIAIFVIMSIIVILIVLIAEDLSNPIVNGVLFFIFVMGIFLSLGVADATRSINKFRKGYDFDESFSENDGEDKDSDEEK